MGAIIDHSSREIEVKHNYFIKPIERLLEKQWEELAKKLSSEIASIELIIAHQKAQGTHTLTIDNITSRKVNRLLSDLTVKKQDTFTSKDKRFYQWFTVAFSIVGGLSGVGAGAAGFFAMPGVQKFLEAGANLSNLSKATDTMSQMTDSTLQAQHANIDGKKEDGRSTKDALIQSENRMKGANDNISQILAKYYEALYQLRIALARMN